MREKRWEMCPVYVGCDGHDFIEAESGTTSPVRRIHLDNVKDYIHLDPDDFRNPGPLWVVGSGQPTALKLS